MVFGLFKRPKSEREQLEDLLLRDHSLRNQVLDYLYSWRERANNGDRSWERTMRNPLSRFDLSDVLRNTPLKIFAAKNLQMAIESRSPTHFITLPYAALVQPATDVDSNTVPMVVNQRGRAIVDPTGVILDAAALSNTTQTAGVSTTASKGCQEGVNYVQSLANGGPVEVMPGVSTTATVTINKPNIGIRGIIHGDNDTDAFTNTKLAAISGITLDSVSRALYGNEIANLYVNTVIYVGNGGNAISFCKTHDLTVRITSLSHGIYVNGATFTDDCNFSDIWFSLQVANATAVTINTTDSGTGQLFFERGGCTSEAAGESILSLVASAAKIGTNIVFHAGNFVVNTAATSFSFVKTANNTRAYGVTFSDGWFEIGAATTYLANIASGTVYFGLKVKNNDISLRASGTNTLYVANNANAIGSWNTQNLSSVQCFGNNIIGTPLQTFGVGTPGQQSQFFRVRVKDNNGFNPIGLVASPFSTTNNYLIPVNPTGTDTMAAAPVASTTYEVEITPVTLIFTVVGSTSLVINGGAAFTPGAGSSFHLEPGHTINFGAFGGSPPTVQAHFD